MAQVFLALLLSCQASYTTLFKSVADLHGSWAESAFQWLIPRKLGKVKRPFCL